MPRGYARTSKEANCPVCAAQFVQAHHSHKYCSKTCKRINARRVGSETTARQYATISGDWAKYYNRLRCRKGRADLTLDDLLRAHERQNGLCALTGEPMTCRLERGIITRTNASIDRVVPGGEYTPENIRLVCVAINKLRGNMSDAEFIEWCRKVANYAIRQ